MNSPSAAVTETTQSRFASVIEVVTAKRSLRLNGVLLVAVLVASVATLRGLTKNNGIAMLATLLVIVVIDHTTERFMQRRIRTLFASVQGTCTTAQSLIETVTAKFAQSHSAVVYPSIGVAMRLANSSATTLAQLLVSGGCAGATVRVSHTPIADRRAIVPLQHTFEPLRLFPPDREGLARFVNPPTQLEQLAEFLQLRPGDSKAARFSRFALFGAIVFGWIVLLAGFVIAVLDLLSGRNIGIVWGFLECGPFIVGLLTLAALPRPLQVFAAPQSLMIRESTHFARTWETKLYVRSHSTLIYWPETSVMSIADDTGRSHYFLCAPPFAEAALRAWLSPQPPPNEAMLHDFRGL